MTMSAPTKRDIEATRKLLGHPVGSNTALWSTVVTGSSGTTYLCELRADTVNGGTYMFCPCPGWKFQRSKGGCRHERAALALRQGELETRGRASDVILRGVSIDDDDPCDDCHWPYVMGHNPSVEH